MRTYNVFRRTDLPELVCAVPEARRVPAFIRAPRWEFWGRVRNSEVGLSNFNHEAAAASVVYNGFYLFQLVDPCEFDFECIGEPVGSLNAPPRNEELRPNPPPQVACVPQHEVAVI
jgi:hypothetical protein